MAVEDLEEARLVYFVLTSVSHFGAVTDLVHVSTSYLIFAPTFILTSIDFTGCSCNCPRKCWSDGPQDGFFILLVASGNRFR